MSNLILKTGAGAQLELRADRPSMSKGFQRATARTDSGQLVEVGDLHWSPATLSVAFTLGSGDLATAQAELQAALAIARAAATLTVDGTDIPLDGVRAIRKTRLPLGWRLHLTLLAAGTLTGIGISAQQPSLDYYGDQANSQYVPVL